MNSRPKIKPALTHSDRAIEKISLILLTFLWAFTIFSFLKLPEIIPIHFDARGRPDNYGNKWTLFLLPVIGTIVYAGITYLNKFPWVFNYLVQITEENVESQYSIATRMLRILKCSIMIIFISIALYSYWTAIGHTQAPGWWFLPSILAIIYVPLIYMIIINVKNRKKPLSPEK